MHFKFHLVLKEKKNPFLINFSLYLSSKLFLILGQQITEKQKTCIFKNTDIYKCIWIIDWNSFESTDKRKLPGTCCSLNLTSISWGPSASGTYSTVQEPSLLSRHVIFGSVGPTIAKPRAPLPAPFVSIVNVFVCAIKQINNPHY